MKKLIGFIILLGTIQFTQAQDESSKKDNGYISGAIGATNNGISLIPSFSLEQPAAIFNMSLGKGRFSFEPEFTFSFKEGRAWYQLYWIRYQVINEGKFRLRAGTHLSLNFVNVQDINLREVTMAERYLVGELAPSYSLSEHVSVGVYFLLAKPYDVDTDKNLNFVTVNASIKDITIGKTLLFSMTPQVYYLNLYGAEGYYVTSTFKLAKKDFPISISSLVNKVIDTEVPSKDFLWNLTLTYSFKKAELKPQ